MHLVPWTNFLDGDVPSALRTHVVRCELRLHLMVENKTQAALAVQPGRVKSTSWLDRIHT